MIHAHSSPDPRTHRAATLSGYERTPFRHTSADRFGASSFHNDIFAALATRGIFQEIHLFDRWEIDGCAEANEEEPLKSPSRTQISRHSLWKLPLLATQHRYLFLVGGPEMIALGWAREAMHADFVIDRNPQTFVPSVYTAKASDFISARQRVYCSPDLPSHIVLPLAR